MSLTPKQKRSVARRKVENMQMDDGRPAFAVRSGDTPEMAAAIFARIGAVFTGETETARWRHRDPQEDTDFECEVWIGSWPDPATDDPQVALEGGSE
jgi:hypothetical protein